MSYLLDIIQGLGPVDPFKNHKAQLRLQFVYNYQNAEELAKKNSSSNLLKQYLNKSMKESVTADVLDALLDADKSVDAIKEELGAKFNFLFKEDIREVSDEVGPLEIVSVDTIYQAITQTKVQSMPVAL